MKGNPTMLVWLGKQYLEQDDKSYHADCCVYETCRQWFTARRQSGNSPLAQVSSETSATYVF
jgi:hypothetical protein